MRFAGRRISSKCTREFWLCSRFYAVDFPVADFAHLGIAAALELPQMGGLATPRKAKRSMEITMVKRKEEWDRRMRARASLEERGFFDWVGGFFDGSKNCYYDGYPAFSKTCASTSAPYIRSPVPPPNFFFSCRRASMLKNRLTSGQEKLRRSVLFRLG